MQQSKKKPAESARIEYRFEGDATATIPLIDLAVSCIRQWVLTAEAPVTTREDVLARASARENLRKVAALAINAEAGLFAAAQGGRKGGRQPRKGTKREAARKAAASRKTIGPAQIAAIARESGATPRTVREALKPARPARPPAQKGN